MSFVSRTFSKRTEDMHEICFYEILMLKQQQVPSSLLLSSSQSCMDDVFIKLAGCFLSLPKSRCVPSSSLSFASGGGWVMELGSQASSPSCYRRFPASKTSVQRSSQAGPAEGRCCFCPAYPGGASWAGQEEKGLQVSLATGSNLEVAEGSKGWSAQAAWEQLSAILQRNSSEEFQDCLRGRAAPA